MMLTLKVNSQGLNLLMEPLPLVTYFLLMMQWYFSQAKESDMYYLISILNKFTSASEKKINTTKSGIIFGGRVDSDSRIRISNAANIPI